MKFIPALILSILLSGCIFPKIPEGPVIAEAKPVQIEKEVLTPCSLLKENILFETFDDVRFEYSDLAVKYAECASKQNNSIKLLKTFGGIK